METIINKGYKFKIIPSEEQKEFFLQSFGCARKIYNMYVDELYRKLEDAGYQNGFIKKSDLHLSKYTDFSKQFDYMKYVDSQCLSSTGIDPEVYLSVLDQEIKDVRTFDLSTVVGELLDVYGELPDKVKVADKLQSDASGKLVVEASVDSGIYLEVKEVIGNNDGLVVEVKQQG